MPTFTTGIFGEAALFDASARQALFTSFIPLHEVSFTIEAFIKPTAYPNPADDSIVGLCPLQVEDYCLHVNIRNEKLYFGFYYNDVGGKTTLALNQWVHTAFVFDVKSETLHIYLNGFLDGKASVTSALKVTSGNFTIGTNEGVALPDNFFQVREPCSSSTTYFHSIVGRVSMSFCRLGRHRCSVDQCSG
jgi:hypothetical protein